MHAIDCPIVSSSWTPAEPLDLSNAAEPDTAPPTTNPWPARVAQAEQVLAEAERDALIDAYLKRFAY